MVGKYTNEEVLAAIKEGKHVPMEACTLHRVELFLRSLGEFRLSDGQYIKVFYVREGKEHKLRIVAEAESSRYFGACK